MIRKMIHIEEEKCNGCGLCASACHEGAIAMIGGKAKLIRDDYCDGLGDCLPACPTGAISFEEREAHTYNYDAVKEHLRQNAPEKLEHLESAHQFQSELQQWPVQIKLVPVSAPYFQNANLLIAADCSAYAFADFHKKFVKGHITLIGCPKLDACDYTEKLTEILKRNDIRSITVTRMEVPCCGGIEYAVKQALAESGKDIPHRIVTISTEGELLL